MPHSPPPETVAAVDLARYVGLWHEIARLPQPFEDADFRDVTATYSLNDDGTIKVVNRAMDGEGSEQVSTGEAVVIDGSNGARLEVSFMPDGLKWLPFTKGDYWIMRLDDDYQVALVGHPERKYLWLLARRPDIPQQTIDSYLATARHQGYDLHRLILTPQSGRGTEAT